MKAVLLFILMLVCALVCAYTVLSGNFLVFVGSLLGFFATSFLFCCELPNKEN